LAKKKLLAAGVTLSQVSNLNSYALDELEHIFAEVPVEKFINSKTLAQLPTQAIRSVVRAQVATALAAD
jgi:hypothetical protein